MKRLAIVACAALGACTSGLTQRCPEPGERTIVRLVHDNGAEVGADGVTLLDWDGQIANPYVALRVVVPDDEATVILRASGPRLYFDLPSTVASNGPTKVVTARDHVASFKLGIFPDRAGGDERYELSIEVDGKRTIVPIHVSDLDTGAAPVMRVVVDTSHDRTGFFDDPRARRIVQQVADDWAYFIDDMPLDEVPVGDERAWVWDPVGSFATGTSVSNPMAFRGFLVYAYGIHGEQLRSGGAGSYNGRRQGTGALDALLRSGTFEVETAGNYATNGWYFSRGDDDWAQSLNLRDAPADFESIAHHEIGHALARSPAWPKHIAAKTGGGLRSARILEYNGAPLPIDATDHFGGVIDPASGFGAFGYEYYGLMPPRRWLITRTDLLALEATGWAVRHVPELPVPPRSTCQK